MNIVDAQVSDQDTSAECAQPQPCASLCSKTFISIVKHWTVANLRTERVLILELGTHIEWLRWGLNGQRVGGGQEQRELKERCAWMVARATRSLTPMGVRALGARMRENCNTPLTLFWYLYFTCQLPLSSQVYYVCARTCLHLHIFLFLASFISRSTIFRSFGDLRWQSLTMPI